jgi:hypothetical protein
MRLIGFIIMLTTFFIVVKILPVYETFINNLRIIIKKETMADYSLQGKRVTCISMDDLQGVPPQTEGTIQFVDGIGQIHVNWDNGSQLALIPNEDKYVIH